MLSLSPDGYGPWRNDKTETGSLTSLCSRTLVPRAYNEFKSSFILRVIETHNKTTRSDT